MHVSGCDDPTLWTAPALEAAELQIQTGGDACAPAQYPLHPAWLSWYPKDRPLSTEDYKLLDRACWRVVDASPASGWTAGDRFETAANASWMSIKGFARSVTVEGRVLRTDGAVAFATPPAQVALDDAKLLAPNANDIVALMTRDAWAERYAMHLAGQRISTDDVIGGGAFPHASNHVYTVHRIGDEIVWRSWYKPTNSPVVTQDVPLGPGTRARIAASGMAVVIDNELVLLSSPFASTYVSARIALPAEASEIVGSYDSVFLHLANEIRRYDDGLWAMPVGSGTLLESNDAPYFFDGARFHRIAITQNVLAFDEGKSFSLSEDVLALIGTPRAVLHGIVFGQTGLAFAVDAQAPIAGPRAASFEDLFGGGELGLVAADTTAYVITKADGTSALYNAPFVDWCD